jgi:hypothetical protein
MTTPKIDVSNLTERDWEKYRHMQHVYLGGNKSFVFPTLFVGAFIGIIALMLFALIVTPSPTPYLQVMNYTGKLLAAQFTQLNFTGLNITHNATMATLITSLSANPQALATLTVHLYTATNYAVISILFFLPFGLLLYFPLFFMFCFSNSNNIPSSFRKLQRMLKWRITGDNRLRAHNYTEQDIVWYHSVRIAILTFTYLS